MFKYLIVLAVTLLNSIDCIGQYQIDIKQQDNRITEVRIGTFSQLEKLNIRAEGKTNNILGDWSFKSPNILFTPLATLPANQTYHIIYDGITISSFKGNVNKLPSPLVRAFYPSSDTVPENLLKCAIQFTQPMRDGDIYQYLTVIGSQGDSLQDIFLPLEPALWNYDRTTLTLWIDPGRVKRDLLRNQQLGKPLEVGKKYRIVISKNWKGVNGEALNEDYIKEIFVTTRDEEVPDVTQWKLVIPKKASRASLQVLFSEKMDYLTALEGITIENDKKVVNGTISLIKNETIWSFTPKSNWIKGEYILKLSPVMEDLSGNNLSRPFDLDLQKEFDGAKNPLRLTFKVE